MRRAYVFLSLLLSLIWLASSVESAALPEVAGLIGEATLGVDSLPPNLSPTAWQSMEAQLARLIAADGAAGDRFGNSVSIDGDTAVVGALAKRVGENAYQGAAYVFARNQAGPDAWGQVAMLTATDGAAGDSFGTSVSISGDTVVVGAEFADVGLNEDQGAAYVFLRNQGGPDAWGQVAKLTATDGLGSDQFGGSVSVYGDSIVVGAANADPGGNAYQGAAYLFLRDLGGPNAWGQAAKLTAADGAAYDLFGRSVAVSLDTVVVGATGVDVGSNAEQGAAYVFARNQGGAGAWGQVARLIAEDGTQLDNLGSSVAVAGDIAVAGAPTAEVGANAAQGAAYVFYRNQGGGDAWGQVAKLTADDGAEGDSFGWPVSVSNDKAIVGSQHADVGGNADQGAAYVFDRNRGGPDMWGQAVKLTAADGAAGDWFGHSVSISGDTAIAGAWQASVDGNANQGAAYVYDLGAAQHMVYLPFVSRNRTP
ncbi:MAG TPA: FG-GAP repeat protein [Anaerolineae bacterium]|nr:FG-GAP repeat protein [Anaerolineae bacterium]